MAIVQCALTGGSIYGWPSMRRLLLRDDVLLSASCESELPVSNASLCDEQERGIGMLFTIGSWSNQGGRFFIGIALDRVGPKWTSSVCSVFFGLGCVAFGGGS